MGFEEFKKTTEIKKPSQEELDQERIKQMENKINRRATLTTSEKLDLLEKIRGENSRYISSQESREGELKKESINENADEIRPVEKKEHKLNDASENIDKELDEELARYWQLKKDEEKRSLDGDIKEIDDRLQEIAIGLAEQEERMPKSAENKDKSPENEKPVKETLQDTLKEREETILKLKELGKKADIDVSESIKEVEEEIAELKKQLPEEKLNQENISGQLTQETKENIENEHNVKKDAEGAKAENINEQKNRTEEVEKGQPRQPENQEIATLFLKEKIKTSEFCDQVKSLANTLRRREEHNFSPLIDPAVIPNLSSAANNLEEMARDRRSSMEDINQEIKRIHTTIDAIGRAERRRQVIEDTDVLRRVASNLQDLVESSRKLSVDLGGQEDRNLNESMNNFRELRDLASMRWSLVMRKRQVLVDNGW